jgi:hypothetical protein
MIRLIRTFGVAAVAAALLLIPAATRHDVALAEASCNTTTAVRHGYALVWVPSYNGNFNCIVGPGNGGSAVADLQTAMNHCYAQNLAVDGIYGPRTTEAMQDAQADLRVTQDGVYGPITRSHGFLFWGVNVNTHRWGCASAGF